MFIPYIIILLYIKIKCQQKNSHLIMTIKEAKKAKYPSSCTKRYQSVNILKTLAEAKAVNFCKKVKKTLDITEFMYYNSVCVINSF